MQTIAIETSTKFPSAQRCRTPLDAQLADRLLDLLSTDDEFRFQFSAAPLEALKAIGYQTKGIGSAPFEFCEIGILASKEAIRRAREELKLVLMQGSAYTSPNLDAGNVSERLVRKTLD